MADEIGIAEREIFGSEEAFSERWAQLHGLPDEIPADPARGIIRPFSPAEVFSDIAETGLSDQPAWYRASLAIEASTDRKFRRAARTGFLRLLVLDHSMRAGRIDTVANMLKTEFGVTPQGVSQWLMVDQETRRCLTLIFRLQGYQMADESGVHDEIEGLDAEGKLPLVDCKFSEFLKIRPDQVRIYLKAVQEAVGTDPGIVRLAYTIFRYLGFPHENGKFAGTLIGNYEYDGKKGDLDPGEVAPFIEKFKDPSSESRLVDILGADGVVGLARVLNRLPAEIIAREWADMQLLLDMMDAISDIRSAYGESAGLPVKDRHATIIKTIGLPMAKRKLSKETIKRLTDSGKIELVREEGMSQLEKEGLAIRKVLSDLSGKSRRR